MTKKEYMTRNKTGIYLINNNINGKIYIGRSLHLYNRMRRYYWVGENGFSIETRPIDRAKIWFGKFQPYHFRFLLT